METLKCVTSQKKNKMEEIVAEMQKVHRDWLPLFAPPLIKLWRNWWLLISKLPHLTNVSSIIALD